MTTYYIILFFSLIILFFNDLNYKLKNILFQNELKILIIISLFLFVGFRYKVGSDWNTYNDLFYLKPDSVKFELGYKYLINISKIYGLDIWGINIFSSFVFFLGFYFLFYKEKLFWLALSLSLPYLIIVVSMGYTRQSISIGLGMILISQIRRGNILLQVFLLFLCLLFHNSSIIYIFFIFYKIKSLVYKILILTISFAILFILTDQFSDLKRYLLYYLIEGKQSFGAFPRLALAYLPILLFIYNYKIVKNISDKYLFESYSIIVLILSIIILFSSTTADRLLLYILPIKIFLLIKFIETVSPRLKIFFKYTIVSVFFLSFHIQFTYSSNFKEGWNPYKNILLSTQYDNIYKYTGEYDPNNYKKEENCSYIKRALEYC